MLCLYKTCRIKLMRWDMTTGFSFFLLLFSIICGRVKQAVSIRSRAARGISVDQLGAAVVFCSTSISGIEHLLYYSIFLFFQQYISTFFSISLSGFKKSYYIQQRLTCSTALPLWGYIREAPL